jgi:GNAT superfamily N-acetyltransferase
MNTLDSKSSNNSPLRLEFLAAGKIPQTEHQEIDELDHIAYQSVAELEGAGSIAWASSQWMGLGRLEDQLIVQLGCLQRKIRVAGTPIRVAGIGGVATHPDFQQRGYASQLMHATAEFIHQELQIPFGLLICDGRPCQLYQKLGWLRVADYLIYQQNGLRLKLNTSVMVLNLMDRLFPAGEIDLCGVPW